MIRTRGRHTVRVTKVTGHATDVDVGLGRVRIDKLGNAEADTTADIGRRHQTELLIDVRRGLLQARTHWYPVMQQLHRFMIAVSRVAVNHLILWFGIREELGRRVRLTLGLMSCFFASAMWVLKWTMVHPFRAMGRPQVAQLKGYPASYSALPSYFNSLCACVRGC